MGELESGVEEMLEVVQYEQKCALAKEAHQLLRSRPLAAVPQTDRLRDHRHDQGMIAHGGELNPDHAVGKVLGDLLNNGLGQTRLADAARTSQRQERNGLVKEQHTRVGTLLLPADEGSAREGKGSDWYGCCGDHCSRPTEEPTNAAASVPDGAKRRPDDCADWPSWRHCPVRHASPTGAAENRLAS